MLGIELAFLGAACLPQAPSAAIAPPVGPGRHADFVITATIDPTFSGPEVRIHTLAGALVRVIREPTWTAMTEPPALAVDENGRIAIVYDRVANKVALYGASGLKVADFAIDLTSMPNAGGFGITDIAFGSDDQLYVIGGFNKPSVNYVFTIDPETGDTLRNADLNVVVGSQFEVSRMHFDRFGQLHLTEWSNGGIGTQRIVVLDPATLGLIAVNAGPTLGLGTPLGAFDTTPGGTMFVGDYNNGDLWRLAPNSSTWTPFFSTAANGALGYFDVALMHVVVSANTAGATLDEIWVISTMTGLINHKWKSGSGYGAGKVIVWPG